MPHFPATLGMEVAGRIELRGEDVTGFAAGYRVAAFIGHGGLAEYAVALAEMVVKVPDAMRDAKARASWSPTAPRISR